GGDVVKPFTLIITLPKFFGGIQQVYRTDHISIDECIWIGNRTVDVRFRSQMNNPIRPIPRKNLPNNSPITDISFYKRVIGTLINIDEILQITCICQRIQVDNLVLRIFEDKEPDNVRTDKPRPASD